MEGEQPDRDPPREALTPLPYRNPEDDRAPISGRATFRIVRWAGYGLLFAAFASLMLFFLLGNRRGAVSALTIAGMLLVFLVLTALCAFMIVATLRAASGRKP